MSTFEELGLSAAIVEGLLAEGIEVPNPLQEQAVPAIRRGTSVVLSASPGSGLLGAYGPAVLDRIEPEGSQPRVLVLTRTRADANALAGSLARLAVSTRHRVGALGSAWAFPGRAHVLFAAVSDLDVAVRSAEVKLDAVGTMVVTDAPALLRDPRVETVLSMAHTEGDESLQIVLIADPVTPEVREFVERHARKAVFVPSDATSRGEVKAPVSRGSLEVRTIEGEVGELVAHVVGDLLDGDAEHVLTFVRSDTAAADLGDLLTLRGFLAGAPGDADAPVWLGLDAMEARTAQGETDTDAVAVVSVDVPSDPDELDRRHGGWGGRSVVLIRPRETTHLGRVAAEAGYGLDFETEAGTHEPTDVRDFVDRVEEAIESADLGAYTALLASLLRKHGATSVAAALASLVRTDGRGSGTAGSLTADAATDIGARPPPWVRLFMSVGRRDGIGAGDLLGAITGETGISGDQVGRIDLRDTFSRVDVEASAAETVIRKLNGTSIRGRSVRVDFDRGEGRASASSSPGGKGGRPGGRGGRPGRGRRPADR